jgi:predicted ribosome quality control (RQC) complex YloA/Tae2 family protein
LSVYDNPASLNFASLYSTQTTYELLGKWLTLHFKGLYFYRCFSTGKEELHFEFRGPKGLEKYISLRFADGEMYFTFPKLVPGFGAACITWFRSLENSRIDCVKLKSGDRLLLLEFSHGELLLFKGFGKLGNVIHFEKWNTAAGAIFRLNLKKDLGLFLNNAEDYYEPEVENANRINEAIQSLENGGDVYLRQFFLEKEKARLIKKCSQQIQHLQKIEERTEQRLHEIDTRRSYKELGDIILTYAHLVKPGIGSAFLPDYYTGQQIRIKLDKDLDAPGNARKYYKKSQNEALEKEKLLETLAETRDNLEKMLKKRLQLEKVESFAELKPLTKILDSGKKAQESKPYREFKVDDFTIWVGKNAKGNDEMLKLAAKNDLWLHVKDWAGSHIIVRKKGREFPKDVIDKAAKLAVAFSKAKSNSLVSVIVTEKKYVVKPKNAVIGEVRVLKERVVDVFSDG